MKKNKDIQDKIDSTLRSIDAIELVTVSPFFKDKTMQRLFVRKEEQQVVWSWFTPKLQFATLVCIVVLNVVVFSTQQGTSYDDSITEFAKSYGLSTSTETTILN